MTAPEPDRSTTFFAWSQAADAIRATTKRLEKGAVLERYLPTLDDASLAIAARFFSGLVFPRHDMRTTNVGGSIVFDTLGALSGLDEEALYERSVDAGDLGDLARELYAARSEGGISGVSSGRTIVEMERAFAELAATSGSNAKRALVRALLEPLGALEAQYAVKLVLGGGELRIGLKEAQVEEALAKAFVQPLPLVRRANLLRGDVGEVAALARHGALESARLALFHPIGFMLAQPLETAEALAAAMPTPFAVEDKYDGIRAQAHVEGDRVALFSRTLDEITRGYPEVVEALRVILSEPRSGESKNLQGVHSGDPSAHAPFAALGGATPQDDNRSLLLDGELIACDRTDPVRALPFKALQRRLGRKAPDEAVLAEVPVAFVVYDVLAVDGALVIDEPYAARRARLERLAWPEPVVRLAPSRLASEAADVERAFAEARAAGNEGLIAKDPASPYTPGRRGKTWVKLKRADHTLDVVVTGAERGHGRRRGVLSDYTFAVRASASDPTLLNVGKAYTGLTDAEIADLTKRFEELTVQRFGRYHQVRPEVVLEVTFDIVQRSARHKAGYALRFPRIVRVRDDKPPSEIDTLARVKELAGDESPPSAEAADSTATDHPDIV